MKQTTTETQIEATPETMKTLEDFVLREPKAPPGRYRTGGRGTSGPLPRIVLTSQGSASCRNGKMPERAILTGPAPSASSVHVSTTEDSTRRSASRAGYSHPSCAGRRASTTSFRCCT